MPNLPDNEQVLQQFRQWLDETRTEVASFDDEGIAENQSETPPVGLYQLTEQLTALRHEVKLLTKAARSGEERTEATLVSLNAAIEQFRSVDAKESDVEQKTGRPFVEALIDLDESLIRGERVIKTARQRILHDAHEELKDLRQRLDSLYQAQSWWRRALCRPWQQATKDIYAGRTLDTQRKIFDSLIEGYDLIQSRLQRTLHDQRILRVECVGKAFDPHRMSAVETISDLSQSPGIVIEEVRPGYVWQGKVIRFAEVKVVGHT